MSRLFVKGLSQQLGWRRSAVAAALGIAIVLCGCSPIASVSYHKAVYAASSGANLAPANQYIATGRRLQDKDGMKALGNYLAAARVSARDLKSHPQDPDARRTYNYAV